MPQLFKIVGWRKVLGIINIIVLSALVIVCPNVLASANTEEFYSYHNLAKKYVREGNYQQAIKILNQSLEFAGDSEVYKGVAYHTFAEIYRDLNDLNQELKYRKLSLENILDSDQRLEEKWRINQIKAKLENPSTNESYGERYPFPPIIGRKFDTYREVEVALANSNDHYAKAEKLYKSVKYEEAIEEYKLAYVPGDMVSNLIIGDGLIKCYRKLKKYDEALTLVNYILNAYSSSASTRLGTITRMNLENVRRVIIEDKEIRNFWTRIKQWVIKIRSFFGRGSSLDETSAKALGER